MSRWLPEVREILLETGREWLEDGVPGRGAALSYYVLLSLGPLLILLVGVAELFLSGQAIRSQVVETVTRSFGAGPARTVSTVLERVEAPELLSPQSLLTLLALLFGATAVFANVRGSLNAIWGVEPEPDSRGDVIRDLLRTRVRAFLMVATTGLLLALSFAVTWAAGYVGSLLRVSPVRGALLVQGVDAVVSILLTGLLFGAIFRTLPQVRIEWRTVWVGAFATAVLFVAGKLLVARIISAASWTSYYGPGASVVAFLVWIYFSAQLFFLGAEFTQVWSRRRGRGIGLSDGGQAHNIPDEEGMDAS